MNAHIKYFQPLKLYDLCLQTVRSNCNVLSTKKYLPQSVYHDVIVEYIETGIWNPEDDFYRKYILGQDVLFDWDYSSLDLHQYLFLMNHPDEIPDFGDDENHCHQEVYSIFSRIGGEAQLNVCKFCAHTLKFKDEGKFTIMGFKTTDHLVVSRHLTLEYIWNTDKWCSICQRTALFQFYDSETCKNISQYHLRDGSNSNEDTDDSDNDYYTYKRVF